jgi:hypothetical protein
MVAELYEDDNDRFELTTRGEKLGRRILLLFFLHREA